VDTTHDVAVEIDEDFTLDLTNVGGPADNVTLTINQGTATITNNDYAVVSVSNPVVVEGNQASFTITLDRLVLPAESANISYTTNPGSATAGSDYTTESGIATITPNKDSVDVLVDTIDDAAVELPENFTLDLSNVGGPADNIDLTGVAQGTGTITDNDYTLTVTLDLINGATGYVSSAPVGIDCGADCSEIYTDGTVVTLTAAPEPPTGTSFLGWFEGALLVEPGLVYAPTITNHLNLIARYEYIERQITVSVNSIPAVGVGSVGGTVSPAGIVMVPDRDTQVFTITPAPNWHLQDILLDGASIPPAELANAQATGQYTLANVTADHTLDVIFQIDVTHAVIEVRQPWIGGSIEPGGVFTVPVGSSMTFTITPDPSFTLNSVNTWNPWTNHMPPMTSYTFNNIAPGNHGIEAFFDPLPGYAMIDSFAFANGIPIGGGQVLLDGVPIQGQVTPVDITADHSLEAVPDAGFTLIEFCGGIVNILDGVPCVSVPNPYLVPAGTLVDGMWYIHDAFFDDGAGTMYWNINVQQSPGGSINLPSGDPAPWSVSVADGGSQQFLIVPDPGYHIVDVMVDGWSVGPVGSYTFTNVTMGHFIQAYFAPDAYYTINASVDDPAEGSITPEGDINVTRTGWRC
jgi:hypothetical protein